MCGVKDLGGIFEYWADVNIEEGRSEDGGEVGEAGKKLFGTNIGLTANADNMGFKCQFIIYNHSKVTNSIHGRDYVTIKVIWLSWVSATEVDNVSFIGS